MRICHNWWAWYWRWTISYHRRRTCRNQNICGKGSSHFNHGRKTPHDNVFKIMKNYISKGCKVASECIYMNMLIWHPKCIDYQCNGLNTMYYYTSSRQFQVPSQKIWTNSWRQNKNIPILRRGKQFRNITFLCNMPLQYKR